MDGMLKFWIKFLTNEPIILVLAHKTISVIPEVKLAWLGI
jgi:hypothetical protein